MQDLIANDRLSARLFELLASTNDRDRLYAYRLNGEKPVKPAVYKGRPFDDFFDFLRDEHRGGDFLIMFRRGETMLLTGVIAIEAPLFGRQRFM
ncbi:MAG: hypothetical protein ISS15_20150 [Alphaproteobacteria bacterium]|nr:hypothetical protein [Alphaproteobacteria bacterium]